MKLEPNERSLLIVCKWCTVIFERRTFSSRIYSLEPLPTNCRSSGIQKSLQSITRGGWRWLEVIEVDQDEDEEDEENEDFCTT
ncbi:uncharacterized protein [Neodiprion pinetum]|uniref:uncharacterized protein isoform X3 n=1 Tax=Neodiprion pinetum TaxID=441929 RepID=UPI003710FEC5